MDAERALRLIADMLDDYYLWYQAVHVIAVIAWMAGMLYLPRLFVYHVESGLDSPQAATFKVMETKLLRIIMNPAMIVAWIAGLLMLLANFYILQSGGWMHLKLALVVVLTVMHALFARWRRKLAADQPVGSGTFFRVINEVPTVLMIGIVIMAVVEPF